MITGVATALVCQGCGAAAAADEPFPFRCPAARPGDDVDHVLRRVLPSVGVSFPDGDDPNPFVRYRSLMHAHGVALGHGMSDEDYVELVRDLDARVVEVDGTGFRVTPFEVRTELSSRAGFTAPGRVWVKDETGNVSGSHKGRHLFGLAIWLEVVERVGLSSTRDRRLAIASCGNAALAAAVVARAAGRPLDVFVPTWADEAILGRLDHLGARIEVVPRTEGESGDPTHRRLRRAIADGAVAFTCQGSDDGLTIEGGLTLGYEIADELRRRGEGLDRVTIQVGGGALASAVIQGLGEAVALGAMEAMPVVDTVQTEGAHPLARAHGLVAAALGERPDPPAIAAALADAASHRSSYMWPWEEEPRSVASGILDDETYDWLAVVRGMLSTGGAPIVVGEDLVLEANELGRATTGIDVDPTGTAGLAGLLAARRAGDVSPTDRAGVLFTGARR